MSKKLAIRGHSTRSKEVIELLEMLGGIADNIRGNVDEQFYYIHEDGYIHTYTPNFSYTNDSNFCKFTLEEFLEKFPFKVGDKVKDDHGNLITIKSMEWSKECVTMVYDFKETVDVLGAETLKIYNKPTEQPRHMYMFNKHDIVVVETNDKKQKWICEYKSYVNDQLHFYKGTYDVCSDEHGNKNKLIYNSFYDITKSDIVRIASPGEVTKLERMIEKHNKTNHMPNVLAELLDHIKNTSKEDLEKEFKEIEEWSNVGPTVEEFIEFCDKVNKKPKYPATYEECCQHLGCDDKLSVSKLVLFQQLINARNAYWKIAGKEMGLDKPWEPDLENEELYCIQNYNKQIVIGRTNTAFNKILIFPSEEMCNAFYTNFKDLIEKCKALL